MNFNNFKNLARIKDLPIQEQHRQYFLYQSNQMYESSFVAASSAAAGAGAGAGGTKQLPFYGYGLSGDLLKLIYATGTASNSEVDTGMNFPGLAVFDKNTDDSYQYFVTNDESKMYFGKFNQIGDENVITIDETNLTNLSYNAPSSLYYEGSGNFIYLDGLPILGSPTFSNVVRVNTNGDCEIVCHVDTSTYYPTSLFPYNGEVWGTYLYSLFFAGVGTFDLNTGEFTTFNDIILTGVPNLTSWKIWFVPGVTTYNNQIYLNLFVIDKDNSDFLEIIANFNPDTLEAKFVSFVNQGIPCIDITTL
jgi:hypothetical protein